MREFLFAVSCREVSFTESAEQLLKNYFVGSRKFRQNYLPVGSLLRMTSLSKAHARLNLRTEVIIEDVIIVISLYEESMQVLFGADKWFSSYVKNIKHINDVRK